MFSQASPYLYGFRSKWKFAEQQALAEMPPNWQDATLPIVSLPPPREFDADAGKILGQDEYIRRFGPRLFECWGKRDILIDAEQVPDVRSEGSPDHPMVALFQRARNAGAAPIPMTGLSRPDAYQASVARIASADRRGAALKLGITDLALPSLSSRIDECVRRLGLTPREMFLIVDLGSRPTLDLSFAPAIAERLANLPFPMEWLEVFLSLTTLPDDFRLNPNSTKEFPRLDWEFYQQVVGFGSLPRTPAYADYGVEQARMLQQRTPMRASAQLRCSSHTKWFLAKGPPLKTAKYAAITVAAKAIVGRSDYRGADFSAGDRAFEDWSNGVGPLGDPRKWRQAGHDHHFAIVFEKLGVVRTTKKTAPTARQLNLWEPADGEER